VFPDVMIAQKFGFPSAQLLEFSAAEKTDVDIGALFST
jgi:LemA protein